MSEHLYRALLSTDFLGKNFNFYVNGSSNYKTLTGGVLSVFIIIGVSILTWYFGQDVYQKKKPNVLTSSSILPDFPTMDVDQSSFNIAFRLEDDSGKLIDDKTLVDYRFNLYNHTIDKTSGVILSTQISSKTPEKCTEAFISKNIIGYERLINSYYCINNTFTLGGDWTTSFLIQPTYQVNLCDKETEIKYNITCSSPNQLFTKYKKVFLDVMILKQLLNPSNEQNPLTQNFELHYFPLKNNSSKRVYLKYSTGKVSTDKGVIFEDVYNRTFLDFDSIPAEDDTQVNGVLVETFLFLLRKENVYTRVYIKIPEVLAVVGGFMSTFLSGLDFIFVPIWDNDLCHFLQSQLYRLELVINRNEIVNESNKIELSKPNENSFNRFYKKMTHLNKVDVFNKDLKDYVERKKVKKEKVIVSKWWRFCFFEMFSCECVRGKGNKEKCELLEAANREYYKKIDVLDLFKGLDRLAVLKKVILNQAQSIMLENKGAKSISYDYQEILDKNLDEIHSSKQKEKIEIVKDHLKYSKLNDVDHLLYYQVDDSFLEAISKEGSSISCENKDISAA